MNIELTEREKQMLSMFAKKQYDGAKDNLGTMTPIHVVERICKQYIESSEGDSWLWSDGCDYKYFDTFDKMLEHERENSSRHLPRYSDVEYDDVKTHDGDVVWIDDEKAYCKAYGITAYKCTVVEYTQPVAFFFIRDEAVRYKDVYQAHNCEDCRIYTYGLGYSSNGDLPIFRALLMRMGEMINSEHKEDTNDWN